MNQNLDEILAGSGDMDFSIGMDTSSLPDDAISEAVQSETADLCRRLNMSLTECLFYAAGELLIRSGQGHDDEKRSLLIDVFEKDGDKAYHDAFYKIEETRAMFKRVEENYDISIEEEPLDPFIRAVGLGWQRYAQENACPELTPNQQLFLDVYETLVNNLVVQKEDAGSASALTEALQEVDPFASEEEFHWEQTALLRTAGMKPDEWEKLFEDMKEMFLLNECAPLTEHFSETLGEDHALVQGILRINHAVGTEDPDDDLADEPQQEIDEIENPRLRRLLWILQDAVHMYAHDQKNRSLSDLLHTAIKEEAAYDELDGETLCKEVLRTASVDSVDTLASFLLGMLVDRESSHLNGRLFLLYPCEPALGDNLERICLMYDAECRFIRRKTLREKLLSFLDRRAAMGALEYTPTGDFLFDVRHLLAGVIRLNYQELLNDETPEEAAADFLAEVCTVQAADA